MVAGDLARVRFNAAHSRGFHVVSLESNREVGASPFHLPPTRKKTLNGVDENYRCISPAVAGILRVSAFTSKETSISTTTPIKTQIKQKKQKNQKNQESFKYQKPTSLHNALLSHR